MEIVALFALMVPVLTAGFGGGMLFARFLIVRWPEQVGLRRVGEN